MHVGMLSATNRNAIEDADYHFIVGSRLAEAPHDHQTRPWELAGNTDLDELTLLCGHHHRATHRKGHVPTVTRTTVTWTRTDGTSIGNIPRPRRCR